jgi:hypothetical protein
MTFIGLSRRVLKDWRHRGLGERRHFPGFSLAPPVPKHPVQSFLLLTYRLLITYLPTGTSK